RTPTVLYPPVTAAASCAYLAHLFSFFNDTPTTEIYTLSLHDALPISPGYDNDLEQGCRALARLRDWAPLMRCAGPPSARQRGPRSEEHTSELQSLTNLVCRLLLEKKKEKKKC